MSYNVASSIQAAIYGTPIIDNHAHPLLKLSKHHKSPLLSITSEAEGKALAHSKSTLAHYRAVRQLSRALGCEETWRGVQTALEEKRSTEEGYREWVKTCLSGIHTVLVDDGLNDPEDAESYSFFDEVTPGNSKRIVRIEQIVPPLIQEAFQSASETLVAFQRVENAFIKLINEAIEDPEVVGFKSVICYRTGLAIPYDQDRNMALAVFSGLRLQHRQTPDNKYDRLDHEGLNEYFVHLLAKAIVESKARPMKPIQFHTGLGDKDITLVKSSPAHLQQFLKRYDGTGLPIVLLHSGYPFVREMGYLATMYRDVYADIGEVFPFLSRDGQEHVIKQITELCPAEKIIWSTDGHWHPETYILAVEQMREVFAAVLTDYVNRGDMSVSQAVQWVEDVLFNNSNKLYNLQLTLTRMANSAGATPQVSATQSDLQIITSFLQGPDPPKYLRICWNDMTASPRMRSVPIRRILSMLQDGQPLHFGTAHASMGLLQTDVPVPGASASGEWRLHPDLSTLRAGPRKGHITCFGDFKEDDGSRVALCPRGVLRSTLERAAKREVSFLVGFEIELVMMQRSDPEHPSKYLPLNTDGHAWCISRAMEHDVVINVLEEAIEQLGAVGINIEMLHPESAPGQYEVVLPATTPLKAVDTLLFTRDVLSNCTTAKGYRMTLHPKPFANAAGTASHMHMSLSTPSDPTGSDPSTYEPFYAGVLHHLRTIAGFLYSNTASYQRVQDGVWSGGTWITWGTQNRETPLRKVSGSHWELKCLDGLANPYLAVSAVLHAGLDGLDAKLPLYAKDCGTSAASELTPEERLDRNITERFPRDMHEALEVLLQGGQVERWMGKELAGRYWNIKKAETDMLDGMVETQLREWIMERY